LGIALLFVAAGWPPWVFTKLPLPNRAPSGAVGAVLLGQSLQRRELVQPQLSCDVPAADGVERSTGKTVGVSNLKLIPLKASLKGPPSPPIEDLTLASDGNVPARPATIKVDVMMIVDGRKVSVPIKTSVTGSGQDLRERYLSMLLMIPVDPVVRRDEEMQYLQRLESQAENEKGTDKRIVDLYKNQKQSLISSFDSVFIENRVGLFEIVCRYSSNRRGFWNGEIQSAPMDVEIQFKGHFFDQPPFKGSSPK
jgi:hypothetical protein